MRSVMVEKTTRLLGFSNLELQKNHVIINGKLGDYLLHLGSGTVHKMPGCYLSIATDTKFEHLRGSPSRKLIRYSPLDKLSRRDTLAESMEGMD